MDWVTTIRIEAQRSSLLRTDELARKYKIVPIAVTQALARQQERGLIERVGSKVYSVGRTPGYAGEASEV